MLNFNIKFFLDEYPAFLEEMKIRCDITNTTFVSSNTIKQDLTIKNADMICSHEEGMNLLTKEYENK